MIEYNEAIHEYLNTIYPVSQNHIEFLLNECEVQKVKPNTVFVDFGDNPKNIFMLIDGVVRSYVLLESGKEVTKTLFTPLDLFLSLTATLNKAPSSFCYQALTNCKVLSINFFKFKEICNNSMDLLKLYAGFLEHLFSINEEKHLDVLSKDAKTRYLDLRERIPNIDNLIPQYQIAAYLNITPVQLSRIRSHLK